MKSNNNNNNDDDDDDDNNNTAMGSVHARGDTFLTFGLKALTETNTSRLATAAEAWVRARISTCGTCDGQSGTGTVSSLSSSGFSCQYHFTVALHIHIPSGG
jgi:hypothetical protein